MNRLSRRDFLLAASAFTTTVACNAPRSSEKSPNNSSTGGFVALEWVYVENLLALGIQPQGIADIEGYQKYVNIPVKLAEQVTDVGTRQEPSLEAIAQLNPQMIFGTQLRHEPISKTLSAIAPTQLFNPYPEPGELDQLQEMEQTFLAIADASKTSDKGKTAIEQMRATLDRAAKTLKAKGASDRPILLGQFVGNAQLRLFTDNSLAMRTLANMGLKNAWNGKLDRYGFNTVWVEALPAVQQAHFLYIAPENDPNFRQLQNNPIWKGLEFVKENRVSSLGSDTWLFGGPLSAQILAEKAVAALGKKQ